MDTTSEHDHPPEMSALDAFSARQALIDDVAAENDAMLTDLLGGLPFDFAAVCLDLAAAA